MKPLLPNNFKTFLQRFDNFKDAEIRSFEVISPTNITLTLATQDSARAYDWITITLAFEGVSDAKILEENKFSFVDMNEGVSLISEINMIAFAIGSHKNMDSIQNAVSFVISKSLKFQEGQF
ncbi:MAG: hypothetical protein FP820_11985 [Sulfurimonas sp.]|jgi:hypothetical protein|nr:hypothetical protein [Sulfurimonas sp.]MBU3938512.1 hypothetical protein [bacterium]MBU4024341.1 hypothetical protein [bacterium]MBU4058995.1 hypothetical protein [bacterium]MBU4111463.1 hypothetical protein [bacterium]